jgi:hypothetical protein
VSAPDYCEVCDLAIPLDEYCDGCREDPQEYAPRHADCCDTAEGVVQ